MRGLLLLIALLGSPACADRAEAPRVPIRMGDRPDAVPARDADPVDMAIRDAAPEIDAAPPTVPPADRVVWYLQRHDDPADGLRAALDPPQTPAVFADLPAPVLVDWRGPESAGAAVISRRLAAGLPSAPLYVMADRVEQAVADVSWLAAQALDHPRAIRVDGRPVLVIAPRRDRAGLNAVRARLDALPVEPLLLMVVDVEDRPWPAADGIIPQTRAGRDPDPTSQDAARLRAGRAAATAAGWRWIPRVGPAPNPRLDEPDAPVVADAAQALVRSLVLGRRSALRDPPVLLVDALGAWRDDRQLDPVEGASTGDPAAVTDGVEHSAYGQARLAAVDAHLMTVRPAPPPRFAQTPVLLSWRAATAVRATRDAQGVVVELDGEGDAEWLLDGRPFRVPPGAQLRYRRVGAAWIDLEFDGDTLHDRVPLPDDEMVQIDLSAFDGQTVQSVVLRATGEGRVDGVRIEADQRD